MKYTGSMEGRTRNGNWRYLEELRMLARNNRKKLTKTEAKLWYEYLSKRPLGLKFLKQKPIGRFIADFYCSEILLVIEIDGSSHNGRDSYDEGRDLEMIRRGVRTIRYTDKHVLNDLKTVINEIEVVLKASLIQGR
ncbi:MAG: endonuclease domain-containing protein [Candidatus Shapirobacteria bacterium]